MTPHKQYDAIIIGSGFGGSVMALNLVEAEMNVLMLERGDKHKPGSFPRTPDQFKKAFWDPSKKLFGLFNVWSFKDLDCIISSGVGGGSLIYANVLVRKPSSWFNGWPIQFNHLVKGYEAVESILQPVEYPKVPPYSDTPKHVSLRKAASAVNLEWVDLKLAIAFGNDNANPVLGEQLTSAEPNMHDVERYACRLCGECYFGCNFGSKNTLDLNYLSRINGQKNFDLQELCEVTKIERLGDDYLVTYKDRKQGQGEVVVQCKYLILAAGCLGTTYLLLKNRSHLDEYNKRLGLNPLSKALGTKFSGNGDLFKVWDGCTEEDGKTPRNLQPYHGPVITGAIMSDPPNNTSARFLIEDWTYTRTLIWIFESINPFHSISRLWRLSWSYIKAACQGGNPNLGWDLSKFFDDSDNSVSTFPIVGMGMDEPKGVFTISKCKKYLRLDNPREKSEKFFKNVRAAMDAMGKAVGGKKIHDFPTWNIFGKTITVHPLGGCPMGSNENNGVVNANGEVFNFPNLFIADGSVVPTAIGPNPALTIAALSYTFSEGIVDRWNAQKGNTPAGTTSTANAPAGNAPAGNAPAGNAPAGNSPTGNPPGGNSPVDNAQGGNVPSVDS